MVRRVLIFGAGMGGRRCLRTLAPDREAVAFVDNDPAKQGRRFCGLPVLSPTDMSRVSHDEVLIASMHADPITQQLEKLGVPSSRIVRVSLDPSDGVSISREGAPVTKVVIFGSTADGLRVARAVTSPFVAVGFTDFDAGASRYGGLPRFPIESLHEEDFDQVLVAVSEPARAVQQLHAAGVPCSQVQVVDVNALRRPSLTWRGAGLILGIAACGLAAGLVVATVIR